MLVFAPDLEQVEEVCGGGVDGDEVFVGFWGGRGEVEDFEVFGTLISLVGMYIFEKEEELEATLTYSLICMPFIVK